MSYYLRGLDARGRQLFEEYLLRFVPFEDGDHIVESGGNDGDFMLALRETGRRLSLTTFEPSPREHRTLSLNQSQMPFLDNAEAHNLALWKTTGEMLSFYVKSESADSSLHEIDGATDIVEVRTTRLDDALPRKRYKLLKLEAEGAEPEILEGASGILDCFDYISADVGFERGLKQESTLPEVTNILVRNGFSALRFRAPRHVVLFANDATVPRRELASSDP
jgi:FkbM family methyltransferase